MNCEICMDWCRTDTVDDHHPTCPKVWKPQLSEPLVTRMQKRAFVLRAVGDVKTSGLLEEAIERLLPRSGEG